MRLRALTAVLTAVLAAVLAASAMLAGGAAAQDIRPDRGGLLMTGGVSTIEGQAGGGLVPWAVIGGYGTRDSWGLQAFGTEVFLSEYRVHSRGVALGLRDRIELSFARQRFDTRDVGTALGLGRDFTFGQDIYGAKLRLVGDLVTDQDRWLPQVTLGVQHKRATRSAVLSAIGARGDTGTDVTVSATKLFLAQSTLVTATLRRTEANQFGLLGFGGDQGRRRVVPEVSAAYLVSRRWAIGAEFRAKPDNLSFAREDDAYDAFAAWFPSKHLSVTAAYTDLGEIAGRPGQRGAYLSLQTGF